MQKFQLPMVRNKKNIEGVIGRNHWFMWRLLSSAFFLALKSLIMSLLSFLLAQLWGNYMFWRIICQILGWKTTWKPFGKVCCYLCYCTALQQTIMIQCHFFWSKSMHQVKFSLEKWLFNPSYLIWFKRYAAAKRISPSTATFRQIIFWCIFCKLMLHNHVKLME